MTTAPTLVTLLVLVTLTSSVFSDCPAIFKRYTQDHTYCKSDNPSCGAFARGVNSKQIQDIIQAHNKHRSKVATGKENIGSLPSASDMLEMTWDANLAAVAQKLMEQCVGDHDCNECRLIQDYNSVGQNLYESWTSQSRSSNPDWSAAVAKWYSEVKDFKSSIISSFREPGGPAIGHFTQVVWSKSFTVGCGYVAFPAAKGGTTEMYACNYGPAGNLRGGSVYAPGKSCSQCPINTCCTDQCGDKSSYPGLCKIEEGKRPEYPRPAGDYLYNCDFNDNCGLSMQPGMKPWQIFNTKQDSYVSIVLKGGESSLVKSSTTIKAAPMMCFTVAFRRGPNVAGQQNNNKAEVVFYGLNGNIMHTLKLPNTKGQNFMPMSLGAGFNTELQYALRFEVPGGAPEQYFEVTSVSAKSGSC